MRRNVWSDIASLRTKHTSFKQLRLYALITIRSKKKNWDLLGIVKSVLSNCSEHACIWHALVDQTFYGQ